MMNFLSKIVGLVHSIFNWQTKDKRKKLPYDKVQIGEHKSENINCAISVRIFLEENTQPPIDEFLKRINFAKPYCPKCGLELSWIYDSGGIDVFQIGYECKKCKTKMKGTKKELIKVLRAIVRKNYDEFWSRYRSQIKILTKGKEKKYRLYSL